MLGSIIGDICGSIYEWNNYVTDKPENIELKNGKCYFTDDSILTTAIAESLLHNKEYQKHLLNWARKYPKNGYGGRFKNWFTKDVQSPYNSYGNGSAMRAGPIGWAFNTIEETLIEAGKSAEVTHNHPEGIKGAKAVAAAIYMARNNCTKREIQNYIENEFKYKLNKDIHKLRKNYRFKGGLLGTCQATVPQAIMSFLAGNDFENSIQIAISLGGDTDTLACITGSISEAFYKNIPLPLVDYAEKIIPQDIKDVIKSFYEKYLTKYGLMYYEIKHINITA
jgi:ADP-ribosylglycohydrolase